MSREWINQLLTLKKLKDSLIETQALNLVEYSNDSFQKKLLKDFPNVISKEFVFIKGIKAQINIKPDTKSIFLQSRTYHFK